VSNCIALLNLVMLNLATLNFLDRSNSSTA
jgi:hypothetical protein